ncbi:uncharacterized protein si:ch211-133n4.6 isoform X2 [Electrophorus electricus]|uniref:uncharacterized protein si:ch211-133n4.6 isoform X2 n=1 Tax=Electrophorus electricus TaxID=8005 RepID=UPI0015CFA15C|nr:uncharacterized protein si:ch211-133n4.6 isoform X2 [Electrophorus electricus]
MLTRNILIFCTLAVLFVEADRDAVNVGPQAMSTDQDSISDEAPTESMNSVSPHQPNDAGSTSVEAAQANGPQVNDVTTADGTKSSTEEQDENESLESKEVVKAAPVQRATKTRIASSRKRSKPVGTSKKRTRPLRP